MDWQLDTATHSTPIPAQPSQFAAVMQQFLDEDSKVDPTFLEESWTLGVPAAMDNWRRREQSNAARERQSRSFLEPSSVGSLYFVEDRQRARESLALDRAAAVASRYLASATQSARKVSAAQPQPSDSQAWTPQCWSPEDRVAQSRIPRGWMPEGFTPVDEAPRQMEVSAESVGPMTASLAANLLGVTPGSTREQLRTAYRRMVSCWHPDRLQSSTDDVRRHATQQMASINEAYRLLLAALQDAA